MFYNSDVSYQSEMVTFLDALVTPNQWYATAFEYNVTGFGSTHPGIVGNEDSLEVADIDLVKFLKSLFTDGQLPRPNYNSFYPIFLPPVSPG